MNFILIKNSTIYNYILKIKFLYKEIKASYIIFVIDLFFQSFLFNS